MLRLVGAALVFGGMGAVGLLSALGLTKRVRALRALLGALEQLERELSFRLTAMPELLERVSDGAEPPAAEFFRRCRAELEHLGEKSLPEIWAEALPLAGDLGEAALAALRGLGTVLGRYDWESQRESLANVRGILERCLAEAQTERRRLGRVHTALGMTAGAVLAILLL